MSPPEEGNIKIRQLRYLTNIWYWYENNNQHMILIWKQEPTNDTDMKTTKVQILKVIPKGTPICLQIWDIHWAILRVKKTVFYKLTLETSWLLIGFQPSQDILYLCLALLSSSSTVTGDVPSVMSSESIYKDKILVAHYAYHTFFYHECTIYHLQWVNIFRCSQHIHLLIRNTSFVSLKNT